MSAKHVATAAWVSFTLAWALTFTGEDSLIHSERFELIGLMWLGTWAMKKTNQEK